MALNDSYRNAAPQSLGPCLAQAARCEPDLATIRERLNDLHGRQDCEIENINSLLNEVKDILGIPASQRADCDKTAGPPTMMGLDCVSEALMKQGAVRDVLLRELSALVVRRKG